VIGRCFGGWIAPFWCPSVEAFYQKPLLIGELKNGNITGVPTRQEKALKANDTIADKTLLGFYIGEILQLTTKEVKERQSQYLVHIIQDMYIEPRLTETSKTVIDVGWLALNYPESPNLIPYGNTSGPFTSKHCSNNATFKTGDVKNNVVKLLSSKSIQKGTHGTCVMYSGL
jgi:hypothetical protein